MVLFSSRNLNIYYSLLGMGGGHAGTILYSCNLALPPFLWSACTVHLMSSLPLALGQVVLFSQPLHSPISVVSLYSTYNVVFALGLGAGGTILATSTFPHFRGQPVQYI